MIKFQNKDLGFACFLFMLFFGIFQKAPVRDKTVPEKCVDRKSKVLDMVKNFQNLQVS
jgi:hypothetical protein